ncbi:MAG: hypothetical protein JO322_15755 [Candidatus Eremiobacteraeota bacterium]|nr:hypothetical protein [Candidatus Eremiobacteraeota bacterium]
MNADPDFELSADMRLIELQRAALGLAPPPPTTWQTRTLADGGVSAEEEPVPQTRTAVLMASMTANPPSGVIPGAVVTASLSVANEGAETARNVVIGVPVPGGAGYRPGSFVMDGRPGDEDAAERFLGAGIEAGDMAPGTRHTFVWKVGVRLGGQPLVFAPSMRAVGAAVMGARTLQVERKDRASIGFAAELERTDPTLFTPKPLVPVDIPAEELPFYELDAEETLIHEAAEAALSSAAPPVVPEPPQAVELEPEPQPEPVSEAEPEPEPEPEPEVPPREAVVLYAKFDRATVAFFERTFSGSKPPTILSHCIFASALACATDANGADTLGLRKHLDAQSQVLHRIQLHERLGKKEPISEYGGQLTASLDRMKPEPIGDVSAPKNALFLETELTEPTLAVISKINEERERWNFVKARQLTLALQAQRLAGLDPNDASSAALENALRVYAQAAMTALQKLFVRLRIDRTTGVLFQTEPQLDAAARALVTAFKNALAE